jgi:competence protein ComEC
MRIRRSIRCLTAGILAALYLAGCAGKAGSVSETVPETTAAQTETAAKASEAEETTALQQETVQETSAAGTGQTQAADGTDSDVDRYEELLDHSGDEGKLVVYFLDLQVEGAPEEVSGDSSILISPDGKVMLLDAGHTDSSDIVVKVLKDMGIEKIDYLVASHPHIDHIGGVPAVMTEFPVETAYRSYVEYTTQTYQNYVNVLKEKGTEVVFLKTGDTFSFGDQVQVEVLGPDEEIVYPDGFPDNSTQFLNNNSLLLKFTYGGSTALFGGDLYVSQERDYIDQYGDALKADLAKANHHGKNTSNLKKWIKTVSPQVVVAMGDVMGSMDVYNNYVKEGAEFHLTLYDGIVKVVLDDQGGCEAVDQHDSWMN